MPSTGERFFKGLGIAPFLFFLRSIILSLTDSVARQARRLLSAFHRAPLRRPPSDQLGILLTKSFYFDAPFFLRVSHWPVETMKKLILIIAAIGVVVGLWLYAKPHTTKNLATEMVAQSEEPNVPSASNPPPTVQEDVRTATVPEAPKQTVHSTSTASAAPLLTPEQIFQQDLETLISPQSTFDQKQTAWKNFKEPFKLDRLISALEERLAINSQIPEYSAVLGQAYMKKCGQTQDIREQATFAMKADQLLETALSLDPSNWDARFTKAVGMSYWPAQLNKGQEVIQEFTTLIQQQEALPSQPHFARTYAWLGEQYQKAGQLDNANEVWQRGAALFPADADLKKKLAAQP